MLSRPPLRDLLAGVGLDPCDLGTHSVRKGSATYCSSGSTSCPSQSSIRLRAGWSTGAVHETYCQYEQARDQHVGRTASGLPVDGPEFAILPPHFENVDDTATRAIRQVFLVLHSKAPSVANFCLASLVYHDAFLETTLPSTHPLRQTQYFQNTCMKSDLAPLVACRPSLAHKTMKATGVPPFVSVLVYMKSVMVELRGLAEAVQDLPEQIQSIQLGQADEPLTRSTVNAIIREAINPFVNGQP